MKITKTPDMVRGSINATNTGSVGGVIVGPFPTSTSSNLGIISSSSNTASWQPIISTITANGTTLLGPNVAIASGSNITLSVASNSVTIHGTLTASYGSNANDVSSAGAVGASPLISRTDHVHRGVTAIAHASNTLYGTVTFTTPGNTVAIVNPVAGTLALSSPDVAEPVTHNPGSGAELVWYGDDIVMELVRY